MTAPDLSLPQRVRRILAIRPFRRLRGGTFLGGLLADRFDRRVVMAVGDVLRCCHRPADSGREAMQDLREIIGVLDADRRPKSVAELVECSRLTGMRIESRLDDRLASLPRPCPTWHTA